MAYALIGRNLAANLKYDQLQHIFFRRPLLERFRLKKSRTKPSILLDLVFWSFGLALAGAVGAVALSFQCESVSEAGHGGHQLLHCEV